MASIERVGHRKNCEQAKNPPCVCPCGGAEHGWQDALSIAAALSTKELDGLRREADEVWAAATRPSTARRKPGPETADGQRAAIKSFIADVVRWLRRDLDLYGSTKRIGEPFRISRDADPDHPRRKPTPEEQKRFIETHVIPRLHDDFGAERIRAFQKQAGPAHFWCELLAQAAHHLHECKNQYDAAQKAVVAALTSDGAPRPAGWVALLAEQVVIEKAVERVFELLPRVLTGGVAATDVFGLIWPIRVLAVLMCREPRRHWAVRRYCVQPIVEHGPAEIRAAVKDRLREAFPADWSAPDGGTPDAPA